MDEEKKSAAAERAEMLAMLDAATREVEDTLASTSQLIEGKLQLEKQARGWLGGMVRGCVGR